MHALKICGAAGARAVLVVTCFFLVGCGGSGEDSPAGVGGSLDGVQAWNIPENELISGGVSRDGIPSLFTPRMSSIDQASYLPDDALVVGLVVAGQPRAYSHSVLDWHEVVNEDSFVLSYCPLTGTAFAFDSMILGQFGVSGLLYRNNLIMFDRRTDSHWPQLRLQSDQGSSKNAKLRALPTIETTWATWQRLYPNTVVMSFNTGHNRPYGTLGAAYPGYNRLDSDPLFTQKGLDNRLPFKQRVHGILFGSGPDDYQSKVYPIKATQSARLINDVVAGETVLVVDVGESNFVISFLRTVNDQVLTFELAGSPTDFPFTFRDNETGSTWNVLGEAVAGTLVGTELQRPTSMNAYWFAWGAFYPGAEIHSD